MNQKVVLPRFDLPGESTHVAIRALWVTGGLVVLATLVLGLAMFHHRSLVIASAEDAAAKIAAAKIAAAQRAVLAPVPRSEPPRGMAVLVAPAAGTALATVIAPPFAPAAPASDSAGGDAAVAHRVRHHSGKLATRSRSGTATATATVPAHPTSDAKDTSRKSRRESKSKGDVSDRLMNQFK